MFFASMTIGSGKALLQTGALRFVEDCKWNPPGEAGHSNTTLAPAEEIVSTGGGNE